MLSTEGTAVDLGRSKVTERKRAYDADGVDVIEEKLDAPAAPSEAFKVAGRMSTTIVELRGSTRPRTPLNSGDRGSLAMLRLFEASERLAK